MQVVIVQDEAAFQEAEVIEQLTRWTQDPNVILQFAADCVVGNAFCLVAGDKRLQGLLAVTLPPRNLMEAPLCLHLQADNQKVKKALINRGLAILRELGYTRFAAINGTGKNDRAWERAFAGGGTPIRTGTMYLFGMEQDNGLQRRPTGKQPAEHVEPDRRDAGGVSSPAAGDRELRHEPARRRRRVHRADQPDHARRGGDERALGPDGAGERPDAAGIHSCLLYTSDAADD